MNPRLDSSQHPAPSTQHVRRAFTLIELMVVVGIIAVMGGITAISFRAIAKDAKLATGKNAVMAVLDHARGLAMKNNQIVMVVFRPRFDGPKKQFVEAVLTRWTGESGTAVVAGAGRVVDRFVPIPNISPKPLPSGIKIAAPLFADDKDMTWMTLSHLPHIVNGQGEAPGQIIGVMFGPDGTCIAHNSASDSVRSFVDFNDDTEQDMGFPSVDLDYDTAPTVSLALFNGGYFEQLFEYDEPFVQIAPFLSVFDDDAVRELYDTNQWVTASNPSAFAARLNDYTAYITQYADRIHFNRYTGVVMK